MARRFSLVLLLVLALLLAVAWAEDGGVDAAADGEAPAVPREDGDGGAGAAPTDVADDADALGLPEASEAERLDMSSGSASFQMDELGPIIVNPDGTMRRIANWDRMTEREQLWTLKKIRARNKERMDVLNGQEEHQEL